jgi:hypothetical protein
LHAQSSRSQLTLNDSLGNTIAAILLIAIVAGGLK